jgi:hypothetical protein
MNQMTSENLSICFVPFLIQQKSKNSSSKDFLKNLMDGKVLITFFIENYKELFDSNVIQKYYQEFHSIPLEDDSKVKSPERNNSFSSTTNVSPLLSMLRKSSLSLSRSSSPKTSPKNSPTSSSMSQTLNLKYDPSTAKYLTIWNKNMFFLQMNQKEVLISSLKSKSLEIC